jgi:hypothetical protein
LTLPLGNIKIKGTVGNSIAFGLNAGQISQGTDAVAIGSLAGNNRQGNNSVAIGNTAGAGGSVSTNYVSGAESPSTTLVVTSTTGIGPGMIISGTGFFGNITVVTVTNSTTLEISASAGFTPSGTLTFTGNQGANAVAIGRSAGLTNQGTGAVAIGASAGVTNQGNNSIILNATGANLDQTTANTFTVAPVRNDVANVAQVMFYNTTSKEVTYGNVISVAGNVTSGNVSTGRVTTTGNIAFLGDASSAPWLNNFNISAVNINATAGNLAVANGGAGGESGGFISATRGISATGNVTGGNILTAGIVSATGNVSGNYFIGNGRQLTSVSTSFENEIHVAQNGNDTSGDGTINYPYLTIQKGVDISANPLTDRRTVVIHPGTYIENVTVTFNNTQIITYDLTGASTTISGTLTLANNAQRLAGLKITNLTIAGNTQAYINSCTVTGQLTKSSSGYVEIVDVDMSVSGNVQITGGGTTLIDSNKIVNLRVANASASVSLRNVNQVYSPEVTAGTLSMFNCFVQASGSTANAITASAGTVLQLFNTTIYNLGLTAPARISVGGFYQLSDTQYDRANSVLGTSLGAISFFQSANIDSVTVNTTVLATGNITGGNMLTAGLISATGNVSGGNLNVTGNIVDTGALSVITGSNGNIALAPNGTGIVTVSSALSVTGNISGNTAGFAIGYLNIPQVSLAANATIAATDAGRHYYSTSASNLTLTIANNTSVSWAVGTAITVVNRGTGNITVAQGSGVSLYLAGNSSTANRTVSTYGMATLINVEANVWMINGTGLT